MPQDHSPLRLDFSQPALTTETSEPDGMTNRWENPSKSVSPGSNSGRIFKISTALCSAPKGFPGGGLSGIHQDSCPVENDVAQSGYDTKHHGCEHSPV